ncbi:MAG: beta-lactamase family protein [Tatlockia sp.]|nr:beta-lactamase family protein [Tatlockia sp.]
MKKLLLIIPLILSVTSTFAENSPLNIEIQTIIDSYLVKDGKKQNVTGIAVSISYPQNQEMIKQNFYTGKTSINTDATPINDKTLFDIGSITKSYVAAIMLQLEAEGKLIINDPIGKWLPQYPMWKDVTIKHLLNMSSGIPNYTANPKFLDYLSKNLTAEYSDEFLLTFASPEKPITSGKTFEYSNTNYILAGLIIEKITGKTFADVLQTRIIAPLELKNTFYPAGPNWKKISDLIFPRKARGYYYDKDNQKLMDLTKYNLSSGGPTGGIVSNPSDQLKWVNALYKGTIFSEKMRSKLLSELKSVISMKTGQPIQDVDKNDPLAFGLGVLRIYENGQRFWAYKGSTLAYRMFYRLKPCNNTTLVVALNSQGNEDDANAATGASIQKLSSDIYKKIIEVNPQLDCHD